MRRKRVRRNKPAETYLVTLLQLTVLLANLHKAAQDRDVGSADAGQSLRQLTYQLRKDTQKFSISRSTLESCLWACNMLHEKKAFWTPWIRKETMSFGSLLESILPSNHTLDRFYGDIILKEKKHGTDS